MQDNITDLKKAIEAALKETLEQFSLHSKCSITVNYVANYEPEHYSSGILVQDESVVHRMSLTIDA